MHTSGLVITFADDPVLARGAQLEIAATGPFTLGDASGPCRAVTLETTDPKAARDWHEWAEGLPGVVAVEVVFVHWDDVEQEVNHVGA
jgi:nitrate reductase NapAB chaperone NapD